MPIPIENELLASNLQVWLKGHEIRTIRHQNRIIRSRGWPILTRSGGWEWLAQDVEEQASMPAHVIPSDRDLPGSRFRSPLRPRASTSMGASAHLLSGAGAGAGTGAVANVKAGRKKLRLETFGNEGLWIVDSDVKARRLAIAGESE